MSQTQTLWTAVETQPLGGLDLCATTLYAKQHFNFHPCHFHSFPDTHTHKHTSCRGARVHVWAGLQMRCQQASEQQCLPHSSVVQHVAPLKRLLIKGPRAAGSSPSVFSLSQSLRPLPPLPPPLPLSSPLTSLPPPPHTGSTPPIFVFRSSN